jgi:hypothetical protein
VPQSASNNIFMSGSKSILAYWSRAVRLVVRCLNWYWLTLLISEVTSGCRVEVLGLGVGVCGSGLGLDLGVGSVR